jgi:hypothetical protein
MPSNTAVMTFSVASETFRSLVGDGQIRASCSSWRPARIPNERIVPGAGVNTARSWHLEDMEFRRRGYRAVRRSPSDVEADPAEISRILSQKRITPRPSSQAAGAKAADNVGCEPPQPNLAKFLNVSRDFAEWRERLQNVSNAAPPPVRKCSENDNPSTTSTWRIPPLV